MKASVHLALAMLLAVSVTGALQAQTPPSPPPDFTEPSPPLSPPPSPPPPPPTDSNPSPPVFPAPPTEAGSSGDNGNVISGPSTAPEPATIVTALLGAGIASLVGWRRRKLGAAQ
jgi:PEP-CTERM motif